MNTELIRIELIKPNPTNPRVIKDEKFKKLLKSIQDFPEMLKLRPIVVNEDMVVLGGNMRLRACQAAGLKEIYIIKADQLTEDQQREFIIKDNVGFGEWDFEMLANSWNTKELEEWGLDVPEFGHDVNSMSEEDVDITQEFDPVGESKGLHRIIFIFDNEDEAKNWYIENDIKSEYKKFGGDNVSVWHINLSTKYEK